MLALLPAAFGSAALASLLLGGRPAAARVVGYGLASISSFLTALVALGVLTGRLQGRMPLFQPTPFLSYGLRIDPLSAAFALALGLAAGAVSIAAIGYARHYDDHGGPRLAALYCLFVASMLLVLLADGVFSFLLAWESMSLVGYLLVTHEHDQAETRRAGFVYLAMAHLGTAFIVAGLFVMVAAAPGAPLDFDRLRFNYPAATRDFAFILCLVGFATKAGAVPLHVWLPRAHPVAPSHVSALMSGVMLKTALYGLFLVTDLLLGPTGAAPPAWWGWLMLTIGLASGVLGALYAVLERDLKRLLAYSSVENVGIALVGFGALQIARAAELGRPIAALALGATLLHVLNHALFKSLLFVGAGAVDQAAGTRDLEKLGGLVRAAPRLAGLFLLGSAAIAALPPLNGFAGEWLAFQVLVGLGRAGGWAPLGALVAAAFLALIAGLAAAAFVKAFGLAFLGLPRRPECGATHEAPATVLIGMGMLAALCVAIGLFPGAALTLLVGAAPAGRLVGLDGASVDSTLVLGLLLLGGAVIYTLARLLGPVPFRRGAVWVCGFGLEPRMQYGADAYGETTRLFFRKALRKGIVERHLYTPTTLGLLRTANIIRGVQNGSLRYYLLYVFATLVALLVVTR